MRCVYVMIRQNETHTEIPVGREIADYEEYYVFTYATGTVAVWDCAGMPLEEVRLIADEYALLEGLGSFAVWGYGDE